MEIISSAHVFDRSVLVLRKFENGIRLSAFGKT